MLRQRRPGPGGQSEDLWLFDIRVETPTYTASSYFVTTDIEMMASRGE